jgi:hypothetical protein
MTKIPLLLFSFATLANADITWKNPEFEIENKEIRFSVTATAIKETPLTKKEIPLENLKAPLPDTLTTPLEIQGTVPKNTGTLEFKLNDTAPFKIQIPNKPIRLFPRKLEWNKDITTPQILMFRIQPPYTFTGISNSPNWKTKLLKNQPDKITLQITPKLLTENENLTVYLRHNGQGTIEHTVKIKIPIKIKDPTLVTKESLIKDFEEIQELRKELAEELKALLQ